MRSTPEVALVNGRPWAGGTQTAELVSPYDRGLHFGDGLFETIACRGGRARFLAWHLERLALGCSRLQLPPVDLQEIRSEVCTLALEVDRAIVKVMITRGPATTRGYAPTGRERPTRLTFRYPWPAENPAWQQDGVRVRTASLRLGENPLLAGLKHLNRLEQILARAESADPQIAESLLFSSSGRLVSGTMCNVFIVRNSRLLTPQLDVCGVAGIMRRAVMTAAAHCGIDTQQCVLHAEDLAHAEEVFLTNARVGIWPVRQLDERLIGTGALTQELQQRLTPLLEGSADV